MVAHAVQKQPLPEDDIHVRRHTKDMIPDISVGGIRREIDDQAIKVLCDRARALFD